MNFYVAYTISGRVLDGTNGLSGVTVSTGDRSAVTDADGRYQIPALPVGTYRIEVRAPGFQTQIIEKSTIEVGRRVTQNFQLLVGDVSQVVTVSTDNDLIDQSSVAIDHVVDQRMVQETPLNGRYFLDLALRVPGSVTPPQGAFGASPMRGLGALSINTGGNREETVNYLVNGITLNNQAFGSISSNIVPVLLTVACLTVVFTVVRLSWQTYLFQARLQILFDVLLVTWLVWNTGNVNSPYAALYIVIISVASLFLGPRGALITSIGT